MTEPPDQWRLRLLELATIEFGKSSIPEQEAAEKARVLKECEKILQEESSRELKPMKRRLSDGPIPVDDAFKHLGTERVEWREAILEITKIKRFSDAEKEFEEFYKEHPLDYVEDPALPREGRPSAIRENLRKLTVAVKGQQTLRRKTLSLDYLKKNGFTAVQVKLLTDLFGSWWKKHKAKIRKESASKTKHPKKPEPTPLPAPLLKAAASLPGKSKEDRITDAIRSAVKAEEKTALQFKRRAEHGKVLSIVRDQMKIKPGDRTLDKMYDKVFLTVDRDPLVDWDRP